MSRTSRVASSVGFSVLLSLVITELRKPAPERTWHGQMGGVVPYELRPPTPARFVDAWWSPKRDQILTPTTWGVGWSINIGRLARIAGLV